MRIPSINFWFAIFILCCGCNDLASPSGLEHIEDMKVREILARSFESAGGLKVYSSIDSVFYRKRTVLYLSDGSVESDVAQIHSYKLQPEVSGSISWQDSSGLHHIMYSSVDAYKSLNGQRIPDSKEAATSSFFSNYYVLFLPFKLMDKGAQLSYEGITELEGYPVVDVIKATYNPDTFENHSTSDEWYLYFNREDGRVLANLVHHPPTFAFIENIKTTDDFPLRMNLYRQTWRTDEHRNKEYLRGEFWYQDYNFTTK